MSSPMDKVLERVKGAEKLAADDYMVLCPAHNDRNPSLHVSLGRNGQVLLNCFAGCDNLRIIEAMGLQVADLFADEIEQKRETRKPLPEKEAKVSGRMKWPVKDADGNLVATHFRLDLDDGTKRIWWKTPEGGTKLGFPIDEMPLYRSETVKDAGGWIVLTEGEKAADALAECGYDVVGTVTGANGTPTEDALRCLGGKKVVLWPDNDAVGRSHMSRIAETLVDLECDVRVFRWVGAPPKGDAADHPNLRDAISDLKNAQAYRPKTVVPKGVFQFDMYTGQFRQMVKARRDHGGVTGISTGIAKMDRGLTGLNPQTSTVVAARTNVGKSLFAGQLGLQAAIDNHLAMIFTLEQAPIIYLDRFAHKIAGVSHKRSREGNITEREMEKVVEAARLVGSMPLLVSGGSKTASEIYEEVEKHSPELVIIDYIQKVKPDDPRASRNQQVGQISRDLTDLKDDLGVALVLAAQINRSPEGRTNKRPLISDIRDSGEIEQDADAIVILHNPHRVGEKDAVAGEVEIWCDKFRFGPLWNTVVRFEQEQNWLQDIPDPNNVRPIRGDQPQMGEW